MACVQVTNIVERAIVRLLYTRWHHHHLMHYDVPSIRNLNNKQ